MKKLISVVVAVIVLAGCTKQESRFVDKTLRGIHKAEQTKKDNERKDRYLEMAEEKHRRNR